MYQLTWTQKENYYKDFIKKPKNKFSSQWVLQRAMANAITKRQSKSYHVNKNDMQFCTQKLQLKDWQQNFLMYNEQASIFKGRKKTDIQIQIELLREYVLQLSGKELKSPQDITQEDIRCLNADIDLFYQQASLFDSTKDKEQPLVSSTFTQVISSYKSLGSNQGMFNSIKQDMINKVKNNIEDEVELGLNTHQIKPQYQTNFQPDNHIPQYSMFDSQTSLSQPSNRGNIKIPKNPASHQPYSKYDVDISENSFQVKKENTVPEIGNYIKTHPHQNLHSTEQNLSFQRRSSPAEDQQTYITPIGEQITVNHMQGNMIRNYNQPSLQLMGNNHQYNAMNQNITLNVQNNYGQIMNGGFNSNQNQIQDQYQALNFNMQQIGQNNNLVQQEIMQSVQFQQQNKIKMQAFNNYDSEEYIRAKTTKDQKNYQQVYSNENPLQDQHYNIYNQYDNKEQQKQMQKGQDQTIKEHEEEKEFYDPEAQIIIAKNQGNYSGFGMTHQLQQNMNIQSLEDPEQYQYMNSKKNQIQQKHMYNNFNLQQQIYDGKNQYINQQELQHQVCEINNEPESILEEKVKHEEVQQQFLNQQNEKIFTEDDFNQFNPQDGGEQNQTFNYYQFYQNQNVNGQGIEEEIEDKLFNNNNLYLHHQQNSYNMYPQLNNPNTNINNINNNNYDFQQQFDQYNQQIWNQPKYN